MPASARVQAEVADRRARVLALRAAGATFQQIADQEPALKSAPAAAMDVKRALEARGTDLAKFADLHTVLELERLDGLERAAQMIMRAAVNGPIPDPKLALRAIDRLQRISVSRRRLLGLDQARRDGGDGGERQGGFIDEIAAHRNRRRRAQGW